VRTPEIFYGGECKVLKLEGILREVDEVLNALSEGKVVRAVHPYYSEVHWARKVGSSVVERIIDSATGEVLLSEVSFGQCHYALLVQDAIETGWLFSVPDAEAAERVFGGEQK
jgi:hypothetical protein